jgi:hypothetical protein
MQKRRFFSAIFALLTFIALPVVSDQRNSLQGKSAGKEIYRIRIQNQPGGLVQVSLDGGKTWATVGRVKVAANARMVGFSAASYVPYGTVAATAVHGLRIKTGQAAIGIGKSQAPLIFSIVPRQYAKIPVGYGGHVPRSSGIITDIDAGRSIFRNFAPFVGNRVFLERRRILEPLPEDYMPIINDVFVIVVTLPDDLPSEIVFENRVGGKVTAVYPDGSRKTITEVVRPVRGVGRYDGTTFTGVGAINTNHGGVITISTAPICPPNTKEGGSVETRGGFMIQPYYHVCEQGEGSPQVMVVGPRDSSKPRLEGTPPLFFGYIGLSLYPESPDASYRVQVRIGEGEWNDVPRIVGKVDDALSEVTDIRIVFPRYDTTMLQREMLREASDYTEKLIKTGMSVRKGTIRFSPSKPTRGSAIATLYVDGTAVCVSNSYPYNLEWNSTAAPNGLHLIEIETVSVTDNASSIEVIQVLTRN